MRFLRFVVTHILALLLCVSMPVFSQRSVVTGMVRDGAGEPIERASVAILERPQISTSTDAAGHYLLELDGGDTLTLVFFEISHHKHTQRLYIPAGEKTEYSPTIRFRNELGPVEVRDFRTRAEEAIRLDPKNFSQIPSPTGNLEDLIKTQIGVSSNNELSSGYSVRGGNFDENLVYVNDIEVYRPFLVRSGQQEGLSFANPAMVQNIVFSAGGFEAKYGDKMSSVLDITYRKPVKFGGSASASLLGGNMQLEGVTPGRLVSWNIGARYRTNAYLLKTIETQGEYRPSSMDIQGFVTFEFNPKFKIELLGNVARNRYLVIPETRETHFGTVQNALKFFVFFDGQELMQYSTYLGAVSATWRPGRKTKLKLISSAYRADEEEIYTVQGEYWIDQLEADLGKPNFGQVAFNRGVGRFINNGRNYLTAQVINFEHKGFHTINQDNELLWGVRQQFEQVVDRLSEWRTVDSAGFTVPYSPVEINLTDVYKTRIAVHSGRSQAYLQYNFTRMLRDSSQLRITAGVRGNYWSFNEQLVVSPRLTVSYKPDWRRDWLFRASGGSYYQPPFYRELRNIDGSINQNVRAQHSIHFVLSGDYIFRMWNRPFKFITAAYYKQLNSIIPYEVDNVRIRYFANNNAFGYATGLDFRVNGEFVKGVESWASMGILRTFEYSKDNRHLDYFNAGGERIIRGQTFDQVKVDSIYVDPGFIPRPTNQWVTFGLFFQDYLPNHPAFKFNLNVQFGTGLPFGPPTHLRWQQTLQMPPYRRVDCGFAYNLLKLGREMKKKTVTNKLAEVWLFAEVFNLLAVQNTVSYVWIQDVTGNRYAIPNYLTNRQLNVRVQVRF
jgi:hypothetical protein